MHIRLSAALRYAQFSTVKSTWRRRRRRRSGGAAWRGRPEVDAAYFAGHFGENSAYFCITPSPFPPPFTPRCGCDATLLYDKAAPVAAQRCSRIQGENDARFGLSIRSFRPTPPPLLSLFAVIKNRPSSASRKHSARGEKIKKKLPLVSFYKW